MKAHLAAAILATSALCAPAAMAQDVPAQAAVEPVAPATDSRPNVLIWMMDDVGFAQLSSFGGLVPTPNIDRVAAMGLRYSNYHTAPICSASRASMLTGRNPHSVNIGGHAAAAMPGLGHNSRIPPDAGTLAANLKAAGYATFALGKWDHLPTEDVSPAGPFDRWPSGQGFDHFYGFLAADTDQFQPALIRDNSPVPTPREPGYHLSADLADKAIAMIQGQGVTPARRPFMMYWATGLGHAPHQAPADWIARFAGKFDQGWDKARETILKREIAAGLIPSGTRLAPRPAEMPAWDSLNNDQKRLYAKQMEVFAAALSYTDAQFGRILDSLEKSGQLANTIIVITSDNGASAEGATNGTYNENLFVNGKIPSVEENLKFLDQWGSRTTYPHYSLGWAVAGNTPFRYYKQTTHEGGIRVPLVVAWPRGMTARGETRGQFVHVSDIAPTVLDLAGVPLATTINNVPQRPMEGTSFAYTVASARAADRKTDQYFELYGNKGLWKDGWSIVTSHRLASWAYYFSKPFDEKWELYNLRKDPGQTIDLAAANPEKVAELSAIFDARARTFHVLPLRNFSDSLPYQGELRKREFTARAGKWRYSGPVSSVVESVGPPIQMLPFRMTAKVNLPNGTENGPVFSLGGDLGGMALHLKNGMPAFTMRALDGSAFETASTKALPAGVSRIELEVIRKPTMVPLTPEDVSIVIKANGETVASRTFGYSMPARFGISQTFDIGNDMGSAVSASYAPDVPLPASIEEVVFDFNRP